MIFGDEDTLSGFVVPMEHKTELKKKYNIKRCMDYEIWQWLFHSRYER